MKTMTCPPTAASVRAGGVTAPVLPIRLAAINSRVSRASKEGRTVGFLAVIGWLRFGVRGGAHPAPDDDKRTRAGRPDMQPSLFGRVGQGVTSPTRVGQAA